MPVQNEAGDFLYIIYLDEGKARLEDGSKEPLPRAPSSSANRGDPRGWHRQNVRAMVKRLESAYELTAVSMTSWVMPTFAAYVPAAIVDQLRKDPSIEKVELSYRTKDYSVWGPWGDRDEGAEKITWGKAATGTDDQKSTSNRTYLIDAVVQPNHPDVTIEEGPNQTWTDSIEHGTHVAGIVAAKRGNGGSRGVNPDTVPVSVVKHDFDNYTQAAFDWVLTDAEVRGIYAVVNLSSNAPRFGPGGALYPFMRRISNRLLLVQSAGNEANGNCATAYASGNPNDGILVVGGVKIDGSIATVFDNSDPGRAPLGSEPGSNYGPCVETWAPSIDIWSTWPRLVNGTPHQYLSGTSMAAPFVTGLASRYGSNWITSPVEREAFIRAKHVATGKYAPDGAPIAVASSSQPDAFQIPRRLRAASISADATLSGSSPYNAIDEKYLSTEWNSGHPAPAWIEIDLGHARPITSLRMTPEMSPAGHVIHEIWAGTTSGANGPPTVIDVIDDPNAAILQPLSTASLNGFVARYVRIKTTMSPSWVAWREIEVYGPPRVDETFIDWNYVGTLNRAPDPSGYWFWLGQLRLTRCNNPNNANAVFATINWINSQFIYSAEFQGRGLDDSGYVRALYLSILHREADDYGLAYWTNQIASGARSREDVRVAFVYSGELYDTTVMPIVNDSCWS